MNRKLHVGRVLFTLLPLLTFSSVAHAQFNRVFVAAKTGNDTNTCNDVLTPCRTFAGAFTQVNAGGEIIALESGGYGPVTIDKAVNINAPAGIVAFIHPPSGDAITINAGATDTVVLRGLTLNGGAGNGITVNTVGQLFVEHCTIAGFFANGINFLAPGGALFMRDGDVRGCGSGVRVTSSGTAARAILRDSYFGGSNNGVFADSGSIVAVLACVASKDGTGFLSSAGDLTLDHAQAVSNANGFFATSAGTLRFAYSLVTQNTTGIRIVAGSTVEGSSPGTSLVAGNGTDVNGILAAAITLQ